LLNALNQSFRVKPKKVNRLLCIMSKVPKSYQGYTENTYASRKGRLCLIKKIHFEVNPPDVTVLMMDNDCEVGTEFDRLQPIEAWLCSICTARNEDVNASQCCFCHGARTYKEQIIVKQQQSQEQHQQQQQQQSAADENAEVSESSDKETSPESADTAEFVEDDATETEPQLTKHGESEAEGDLYDVEHEVEPEPEPEPEPEEDLEEDDGMDEEEAQGQYGRGNFYSPFYQHQPMYGRPRPRPQPRARPKPRSYGRRNRQSRFGASPFGAFGGFW